MDKENRHLRRKEWVGALIIVAALLVWIYSFLTLEPNSEYENVELYSDCVPTPKGCI